MTASCPVLSFVLINNTIHQLSCLLSDLYMKYGLGSSHIHSLLPGGFFYIVPSAACIYDDQYLRFRVLISISLKMG